MKFVHLSDLHLGKRVNGYSMIEDQKYILLKILNVIDEQKAENATQKIETVRVTVTWNDPQSASMILDGYILVSK